MYRLVCSAILGLVLLSTQASAQNLLRNGSFEATPCATPCNQGPWMMPSEWLSLMWFPTTYSNDGSYGLPPEGYGNFNGATAQDGIRWVAGWSASPEVIGQVLSAPLVPGKRYVLSVYMREAVRSDLTNPGTYQVELWGSTDYTSPQVVLGSFRTITNQNAWERRTLVFTAPAQAASLPVIAFRPLATKGTAYPGLDNVVLTDGAGDSDGDGIADADDQCPGSDMGGRVVIGYCETGVANRVMSNGCTVTDAVLACQASAKNHGDFVSCVALLTNAMVKSNVLTGLEKGQIQSCAAQAR